MRIFDTIYRDNLWNGVESRSGPGSGTAATRRIRTMLLELVAELGVRSVLDIACGDGYWMPDLPGYVGIDVAPEAIALARERHPARDYRVGNAAEMQLPHADLVIIRDAIQHLPFRDARALLANLPRRSWLLASTFVGGANIDIPAGDCYSPDLSTEPFGLGQPQRLIFDGHYYHEHDTEQVRDPSKHLGLWWLV